MHGFSKMMKRFQRMRNAVQTVLGISKRGYFIPYRYADQIPSLPRGPSAYPTLESRFKDAEPALQKTFSLLTKYAEDLCRIGMDDQPPSPRWGQDWFPGHDAAVCYAVIRDLKPARIVEIGSGHSTRFMMRAIGDEGLNTILTAIDPAPRADLSALEDIRFHRDIVQNVALSIFGELEAGDILSIDSSHILVPGSDVDILLNTVIPLLPSGVYVHIHDMYLPFDYPQVWHWRGYNEQSGVGGLLANGWSILWSSVYANHALTADMANSPLRQFPLKEGAMETSLWLHKP